MKKILIIMGSVLVVLTVFIGSFVYRTFYSMETLPKGEYLTEAISPSGEYTVKAYLCNGGATVDYAVRGELINNSSEKTKNIYWEYKKAKADIKWIDKDTVNINGHMIEVPKGKYDWRNIKLKEEI